MPNTPPFPPNPGRRVDLLAYPRCQLLDIAGPLQVFATANELAGAGQPPYAPDVISAAGGAVATSAGLALVTSPLPTGGPTPDTLIIAGGPGVDAVTADADLVEWLRGRALAARRYASVCSGALALAQTGLLDGKPAATHWTRCAELARRFPAVRVEPDPIFVREGPAWSSAGVTAGIDLALAMVEEDLGRATSLAVARHLVMFLKRPGGQAQFSTALALQGADRFDALHRWIAAHLAGELTLPVLAAQAGMSERSFSRHYQAATGLSPARAVERLRVEAACTLLADSALSIKRVARRCGFGSEETMRRSFLRLLAVTPQDYRARFSP